MNEQISCQRRCIWCTCLTADQHHVEELGSAPQWVCAQCADEYGLDDDAS